MPLFSFSSSNKLDQVRMLLKYQRIQIVHYILNLWFHYFLLSVIFLLSFKFFWTSEECGARKTIVSFRLKKCERLRKSSVMPGKPRWMCEGTFSLRNIVSLIPQSSWFACSYSLRFEVWLPENENPKWLGLAQHCCLTAGGFQVWDARRPGAFLCGVCKFSPPHLQK